MNRKYLTLLAFIPAVAFAGPSVSAPAPVTTGIASDQLVYISTVSAAIMQTANSLSTFCQNATPIITNVKPSDPYFKKATPPVVILQPLQNQDVADYYTTLKNQLISQVNLLP